MEQKLKGKTILIIEDNEKIRNLIGIFLSNDGYEVLEAKDGLEGKEMIEKFDPCFIVLDLMLPYMSGEELCTWIRNDIRSNVPLIMLTAKSSEQERIRGLRLGADDYIVKPFSPSELVARIETVLKRTENRCNKISYMGLTIRPYKREARFQEFPLELTGFEFNLLLTFMKHPGQILTREQLLNIIYANHEKSVTERTIDVHIKHIREKLAGYTDIEFIQTVRGMGYRFAAC
ncbi:response regulator transcription factor [Metabacillus sp. 113a]|uniref:response regulator transcription factor n=1 Tax=Metabacillus sp. 113a TaxID=3404706 RepID=UPI003CF3066A